MIFWAFVWDVVATIENAIHGFRKSGLFPLDPKGIDLSKLEPSKHANIALIEDS
ncbi:hypothetical protein DPMN_004435 [Dreissena polymorpha]|uniref:Uncharacterized protein n=1 Tax=Dreissena polymorpha TaxID=45954 RepID=A0A9D4MRA7_DREPO|nr:hypothetical protein DPMN_004435 [Dreissena polymorpha]